MKRSARTVYAAFIRSNTCIQQLGDSEGFFVSFLAHLCSESPCLLVNISATKLDPDPECIIRIII